MKFSTDWFSKLLRFRRSKVDEIAAEGEKIRSEADEGIEPSAGLATPGWRERLLNFFKRGKVESTDESGQETEELPTEVLPKTQPSPVAGGEEAAEDVVEIGSKPGLWTRWRERLLSLLKRGKVELADESGPGAEEQRTQVLPKTQPSLVSGGEEVAEEDVQVNFKPGLWARLLGMFRRRKETEEGGSAVDATELFSWGEGEGRPAAEQRTQVADKGSDKRKQLKDSEVEEDDEESSVPALGQRIGNLFKKKIVVLGLLLGVIMIGIATGGILIYKQRQHVKAQLEALEKKNKQLEAENRKLQVVKQKSAAMARNVPSKPAESEAGQNVGAASDQGAGNQAGSSADDCTVNNKASAADVLKRCIENFNAADRR